MPYRTPPEVAERKQAKRRLILDTAAQVFSQKGYYGTTVKDVVQAAGVSVGSFYFYFTSKEALFDALYDEMASLLINLLGYSLEEGGQDPACDLARAVTMALWSFARNQPLSKLMLIESVGLDDQVQAHQQRAQALLCQMLARDIARICREGQASVPDPDCAALCFWGAIQAVVTRWLLDGCQEDLLKKAYPLCMFLLGALGIQADPQRMAAFIDSL
ncbi:MAG: TetR/AcrR family transcriptional regulator [Christensenellales bacterium]|jgi:AcrR family transcriptional regulator